MFDPNQKRDGEGKWTVDGFLAKNKTKHSPEQMEKWAKEKQERDAQKSKEAEAQRQEEKKLIEKKEARLNSEGMGNDFKKEQKDEMLFYLRNGDRQGFNDEGKYQTINSIETELKNRGIKIDHVSHSMGEKSKSLYVKVGERIIRVSDHELPLTSERQSNRERGLTGRWDKEIVVFDWQSNRLNDYITEILN